MGIALRVGEHCKHSNKKISFAEHETCNAEVHALVHWRNRLPADANRRT